MDKSEAVLIRGLTANGNEYWYTGRAGHLFVSPSKADAFRGYGIEGARRKATQLNKMSAIHGLRFVAVVADYHSRPTLSDSLHD